MNALHDGVGQTVYGYIDGEFHRGILTHQFSNGQLRVRYGDNKESRCRNTWQRNYEQARGQAFWAAISRPLMDLKEIDRTNMVIAACESQEKVEAIHLAAMRWEKAEAEKQSPNWVI